MLLDLPDLITRAERAYHDGGQQRLREKYRALTTVLYNRHPIVIPPSLEGRALPVYAGVPVEKMTRAAAQLTDREGVPRITVAAMGTSSKAQRERETVQNWLTGGLRTVLLANQDNLDALLTWDLLLYAQAWVSVMPEPAVLAEVAAIRPRGDELDLAGAKSVSEIWGRVNDYLATVDDVERTAREQERVRRRAFPIAVRHVPADTVIPRWSQGRLEEVIELSELPVSYVLDTYRDTAGKPLATELDRAVKDRVLTGDDVCTVIVRADKDHMQVAVGGFLLEPAAGRLGRQFHGGEEIIWEGPHGMGCVPYAYFPGRVTGAAEPRFRYYGFIDPILDHAVALDNLLTQRGTAARTVAWPQLYVERGHQLAEAGVGGGDKPTPIQIDEGGVFEGLGPGESFRTIPWGDGEGYRLLDQTEAALNAYIDRHTFGPSMYGAPSGDSGYMLAQMQAAAESVLAPFKIGKMLGYVRLTGLMVRAARWLLDAGCGAIPVRYQSQEGIAWVEMTEELAAYDWDVSVEIDARPIGGDQALLTMLRGAEDAGYIAHSTAMARFGVREPEKEKEKILTERVEFSPEVQQQLTGAAVQKALAALAKPEPPALPEQPVLPAALAGLVAGTGDPAAAAAQVRMPDGETMPSPAEKLRAAGAPTPGQFRRQGGGVAGQGQATPGGTMRQSDIAERRGQGIV